MPLSLQRLIISVFIIFCAVMNLYALSDHYTVRFSDVLSVAAQNGHSASANSLPANTDVPNVAANDWLKQQGWKQVWPPSLLSKQALFFSGPSTQRFLRLEADSANYILVHELNLDPHSLPWLGITWSIERFPEAAAMDTYKRGDHAIAVLVSFGEKLPSAGLLPNVPRALAFFWGETENVGTNYTCVTPRNGPADIRLHCKFPHVHYIALRRGEVGSVYTDSVNLVDYFQQYFPDYWQEHQKVPPIVGVSLEAASHQTQTFSSARVYRLDFTAQEQGKNTAQRR